MKEQEIRKSLSGKLREFRLKAGMTAKEVGDKIGRSEKTISGWEHGRGQPDADMLFRLCQLYGVKNIGVFYDGSVADADSGASEDEEELLCLYRLLNSNGKTILLNTARGFAGNPDMQKENAHAETA